MASNEITFTLKINDKGNLEGIAQKAKKGAKGLDDVGKSARTADRNLKGAAQASSNSTKNFSKMAQGLGGVVVPAYAAFAAQMFALSAAFEFFKRAGNLKVLQAGQEAYASATGVAMKSLSQDIQAATGQQVAFTDASQAAAIGIASGLNTDQLIQLGKAAKDVSAVLGRDVTDSFNRLVRGVTKAEPELLDELGIVLRLEKAKKDYAEATGKEAESLTEFERSQAVANAVLEQAESKYSRILEVTGGGQASAFNQLGVALNEVVMTIQKLLLPVAETLAKVLTEAPLLAGAAFTLLLSGPLKAVGFNIKDIAKDQQEMLEKAVKGYKAQEEAIIKANAALTRGQAAAQTHSAGATSTTGIMGKIKGGEVLTAQEKGRGISAANAAIKRTVGAHTKVIGGMYDGMTRRQVQVVQAALSKINIAEQVASQKSMTATQRMALGYQKLGVAARKGAAMVASAGSKLLAGLGWIGMIATVFMMAKDVLGFGKKISDEAEAAERAREKVKGLNDELKNFIAVQRIMVEDGSASAIKGLGAGIGSQIGAITGAELERTVTTAKAQTDRATGLARGGSRGRRSRRTKKIEGGAEAKTFVDRQLEAIALLEESMGGATFSAFDKYKKALQDGVGGKELAAAAEEAKGLGTTLKEYPRLQKDSLSAAQQFMKGLAPLNATEQAMVTLNAEKTNLLKQQAALAEGGELSATDQERLNTLNSELEFMKQINDAAHVRKKAEMETGLQAAKNAQIRNPVEKAIADAKVKQSTAQNKINATSAEIKNINDAVAKSEKGATDEQNKRLEILRLQSATQQEQKNLADQELQLKQDLKDIELEIFKIKTDNKITNASKQVNDILMKDIGAQKTQLDLAEKTQQAEIERNIAKMKRETPLDTKSIERARADMELKLAEDLKKTKLDIIEQERVAKQTALDLEYILLDAKLLLLQKEMEKIAADEALYGKKSDPKSQAGQAQAAAIAIGNTRDNLNTTKSTDSANIDTQAANATAGVTDNIDKLEDTKNALKTVEEVGLEVGKTLQSSMESAFMSLVDGSKSAKEAFSDMAQQVLKMIAKMIIEMLVLKALQAMGIPGFSDGGVATPPKARSGGMFGGGNKIPGYSSGGVASGSNAGYPVMLHGTEAVVPLPNNREIPVEMKGAAGQVNNVSVSVNVANDGQSNTSVSGTGQNSMGKGLGDAISAAVVQELAKQKRNGGMLSPYGAA